MPRNIAEILKVRINSTSTSSVLSEILTFVAKKPHFGSEKGHCLDERSGPKIIFTPNPEFLVAASRNPLFRETLNRSDINVPDGFGLIVLAKILGQGVGERISGADLVAKLLAEGNEKGWQIGVAGARRGNKEEATRLLEKLQLKFPQVKILNLDDPANLNESFELVLACQGMIEQENWIMKNKDKVKGKVFLGIGGALDFLTGFSQRAPVWMQRLGLEWLWRGLQKPGHWKRVFTAVIVFPVLVMKEKLIRLIGPIRPIS